MNQPATSGFFASRWNGGVPLNRLFWRDMIAVGSLINLAASVIALIAVASGAPSGVGVALHFAPVPYNLFLFAAVWRNARRSAVIGVAALLWVVAACLV